MLGLPSDLQREILLRLPGSSLLRFRAVCKSWCHEIDDPSFVRAHTVNNHRTSTSTSNLLLTTPSAIYSLPVDSLRYVDGQRTLSATRVQSAALLRPGLFAASCNGLVLISHYDSTSTWVVWNPLTGDYLELPRTGLEDSPFVGCGIGYDRSSDDYKVISVREVVRSVYQTHIYSLRSKSWKRIEDCPSLLLLSIEATLLNGALYWFAEDSVVALDLATDRFRKLPLPYSGMSYILGFEVLGGSLVVVRNVDMREAWVLKEDYEWVGLSTPMGLSLIKDEKRLVLPCGRLIIHWDLQTHSQKLMRIEKLVKIGDPLCTHIVEESIFRFGRPSMAARVKRKSISEADERRSACVEKIQVLFCERQRSQRPPLSRSRRSLAGHPPSRPALAETTTVYPESPTAQLPFFRRTSAIAGSPCHRVAVYFHKPLVVHPPLVSLASAISGHRSSAVPPSLHKPAAAHPPLVTFICLRRLSLRKRLYLAASASPADTHTIRFTYSLRRHLFRKNLCRDDH
ncbi:Unknown protein [Striga hermonthica]|uniref:F-box domain-containing protein n=1 Tax=Striga hermonthica TaxID=68872 RepID=A0A9N7R023_STRHE|nr:Unknown protein [Striga hermonthica]